MWHDIVQHDSDMHEMMSHHFVEKGNSRGHSQFNDDLRGRLFCNVSGTTRSTIVNSLFRLHPADPNVVKRRHDLGEHLLGGDESQPYSYVHIHVHIRMCICVVNRWVGLA